MADNGDKKSSELTEEGMLVVGLMRSLTDKDVDEAFRKLGRYLDKHRLRVSRDVAKEYHLAGRIRGD